MKIGKVWRISEGEELELCPIYRPLVISISEDKEWWYGTKSHRESFQKEHITGRIFHYESSISEIHPTPEWEAVRQWLIKRLEEKENIPREPRKDRFELINLS